MKDALKDSRVWLIGLCLLFAALFLQQCNKTSEAKAKSEEAARIAEQNLKAMSDSTVILKMTRDQLVQADAELAKTVHIADSIIKALGSKKDKVREVVKVVPVVVQRDAEVYSYASVDSTDKNKHNLHFTVDDSVKSFNGISSFFVHRTDSTVNIVPGTTQIKDFKLNFTFSVIKYDDLAAKVTRYKIVPFYVDPNGVETQISPETLKFNFRGVELLDKPYEENKTTPLVPKKTRLVGKWGLGLNPLGYGPVVSNGVLRLGYAPSISFGYFLTFEKR